jgi:hypothetical protein
MSSRSPATSSFGPDGNLSRRDQQYIERDVGSTISTQNSISFTAPGTIACSANSLNWTRVGGWVEIRGSNRNSRVYNVLSVAGDGSSLTVVPAVLTTEAAGPLIQAMQGC